MVARTAGIDRNDEITSYCFHAPLSLLTCLLTFWNAFGAFRFTLTLLRPAPAPAGGGGQENLPPQKLPPWRGCRQFLMYRLFGLLLARRFAPCHRRFHLAAPICGTAQPGAYLYRNVMSCWCPMTIVYPANTLWASLPRHLLKRAFTDTFGYASRRSLERTSCCHNFLT